MVQTGFMLSEPLLVKLLGWQISDEPFLFSFLGPHKATHLNHVIKGSTEDLGKALAEGWHSHF